MEVAKLVWSEGWPRTAESKIMSFRIFEPNKWPEYMSPEVAKCGYMLVGCLTAENNDRQVTMAAINTDLAELERQANVANKQFHEAADGLPVHVTRKCPGCGGSLFANKFSTDNCGSYVAADKSFHQSDVCKELCYLRKFKATVLAEVDRVDPERWQIASTILAVSFVQQFSPEDDAKAFEAEIHARMEDKVESA